MSEQVQAKAEGTFDVNDRLAFIPLDDIKLSPDALRVVDQESVRYQELLASVKESGVLDAICVRPTQDAQGNNFFEVINGAHRFTAAKAAGLKVIPAQIKVMNQLNSLVSQIITNYQRVDTTPASFAAHLKRIMALDPLLSLGTIAARMGVSTAWVQARLALTKITNPEINKLIDDGTISLRNATTLAGLRPEDQLDLLQDAITDDASMFAEKVSARRKAIQQSLMSGGAVKSDVFEPTPHFRNLKIGKEMLQDPTPLKEAAARQGVKLNEPTMMFVLKWLTCMDDETVAENKAKFDKAQADKAAAKNKRNEEKQKRDLDKAEKAAAEAVAAAEAARKSAKTAAPI
jgi:ParB/RepB/Spo0J family partition protein